MEGVGSSEDKEDPSLGEAGLGFKQQLETLSTPKRETGFNEGRHEADQLPVGNGGAGQEEKKDWGKLQ